jgi:hypothetical protein
MNNDIIEIPPTIISEDKSSYTEKTNVTEMENTLATKKFMD